MRNHQVFQNEADHEVINVFRRTQAIVQRCPTGTASGKDLNQAAGSWRIAICRSTFELYGILDSSRDRHTRCRKTQSEIVFIIGKPSPPQKLTGSGYWMMCSSKRWEGNGRSPGSGFKDQQSFRAQPYIPPPDQDKAYGVRIQIVH